MYWGNAFTFDSRTLAAENDDYAAPTLTEGKAMQISLNFRAGAPADDKADELPAAIYSAAAAPDDTATGWALTYDVVDVESVDTGEDGTTTEPDEGTQDEDKYLPYLPGILDSIKALPSQIAEKISDLFSLDEDLVSEVTDAFKKKFSFISTLKQFSEDLFGMTPESEPPVIWVHLEDGESIYGYDYGGTVKALDLAWYQKYKASVDGILGGFLWLWYLWMLFKRAPGIISGLPLSDDDAPRSVEMPDVSSAPRLGRGNPDIGYGEGFTFRKKR